jgi:hypothetical protein
MFSECVDLGNILLVEGSWARKRRQHTNTLDRRSKDEESRLTRKGLAHNMIVHESHHSGLRPVRFNHASPEVNRMAMMTPYAMKPLPLCLSISQIGVMKVHATRQTMM